MSTDICETLTTSTEAPLRYEDIAQDGRLTTLGMPQALGPLWFAAAEAMPLMPLRAAGLYPILTHLSMRGSEQAITLARPLDVDGRVELAHTRDEQQRVNRLLLDMSAELRGARGVARDAELVDGDGEIVVAGRVSARHVFTRPFAPREQRRVLRFEHDGLPDVPSQQRSWQSYETLLELPADARPLDARAQQDVCPVAFGLHHSDSNQHVNSLVYLRLFEDAALHRLAAHGHDTALLSRSADIAYRKPFFVGQRAHIALQCFELPDAQLGALGWFCDAADDAARPHCALRLLLRRSPAGADAVSY